MPEQTPEAGRSGVTLIYDTGERDDDALERLQWVMPAAFLGAVLVLFFAVMEWFEPRTPVISFVGVICLPMGAVLLWRLGLAKWKRVAVIMALVGSFAVPLLGWNVGVYRAAVFTMVQELTPADLSMKASNDRSERVAALACEQMLESRELAKLQRAKVVLEDRPAMAARCLESLDDDGRAAAVRLARHLHLHWYQGWMLDDEPMEENVGCEAARSYEELGRLYGDSGTPQLLSCALGADSPAFARCCGEALTGIEERTPPVAPEHWIQELEKPLFMLLLEAADLPARRLLSDDPVVESLEWAPRELFHWKTHLGCHLTQHEENPEPIARQLSQTIETQCGLDIDDPLDSHAGVRFVERTCEEAVWTHGGGRTVDVVEWCDAARTANREAAFDAAKFLVHRALRAHDVDVLEMGINRGEVLKRGMEQRRSPFAVDDGRRITPVDEARSGGVRLGRPQWTSHTPESERRRQAMEESHRQRRDEARRDLESDGRERSDEELRREVEREAGQRIMEDIEALRQGR